MKVSVCKTKNNFTKTLFLTQIPFFYLDKKKIAIEKLFLKTRKPVAKNIETGHVD